MIVPNLSEIEIRQLEGGLLLPVEIWGGGINIGFHKFSLGILFLLTDISILDGVWLWIKTLGNDIRDYFYNFSKQSRL